MNVDSVKKLPREVQAVLGGGVLYLILSFLDWQQVSAFGITAGRSEWTGFGIIAGLVAIALLVWEGARLFGVKVPLGELSEGLVSVGLALLLALFTVITFLTHGTARHWPAWIGLIVALAIAGAAGVRARNEGVQMPQGSTAGGAAEPESAPRPEPPPPPVQPEPEADAPGASEE
jgi:hypothetical protein